MAFHLLVRPGGDAPGSHPGEEAVVNLILGQVAGASRLGDQVAQGGRLVGWGG